jgi:hypothetical protein
MVLLRTIKTRSLEFGSLRPKIRQPRGASEIDRTLSCIREVTFFDDHITRAALQLNPCARGETFLPYETAAGDERVMTANKVDALATPASDRAIADRQLVEARALDAIVIALRADVADLDAFNRDASGGIREIPAVVEIETVPSLPADTQVPQSQVVATGEVPCVSSAFKMRRIFCIEGFDGELFDATD